MKNVKSSNAASFGMESAGSEARGARPARRWSVAGPRTGMVKGKGGFHAANNRNRRI